MSSGQTIVDDPLVNSLIQQLTNKNNELSINTARISNLNLDITAQQNTIAANLLVISNLQQQAVVRLNLLISQGVPTLDILNDPQCREFGAQVKVLEQQNTDFTASIANIQSIITITQASNVVIQGEIDDLNTQLITRINQLR